MCSSWKTKENEILTLEDYTRLFAGLAKINGPDTLVQITGGEPLSHKYVYEIIRLGKENNLKIGLNTNGFLVDKKVAKKIVDSGLDILVFSLDGSNSEIHDKIRGVPGSFDRVIRGIKLVKAYAHSANKDIAITINTVISALNLHDI